MSARPRRTPRTRPGRLLRGLLGVLLGAGALLAPALTGVLPAGAAAMAPTPSPSPSATSRPPVQVSVTDVTPQVLRPGDELVVRATVRNMGDRELTDPRATLRIRRFLISTRGALHQWVSSGTTDPAGTPVQSVALGAPLAPGAQVDVELRVPASALGLAQAPTAWGPRGISVDVTDAGRRQGLDRTFTVWLPADQVTPTRVSVAVPLTGDAVDPTAGRDATGLSTGALARLSDVLEVTADRPEVAWVVDPALLAAVAADDAPAGSTTGTAARVSARGLAAAAAGRDVFALPSLDPDLATLAHAGAGDVAAVATGLAASAPLPVLGTPPRTDLAWPADPVPDQATVTLAAQNGARAVVVGGDGLTARGLTYTPTGRANLLTSAGTIAALVADPTLTNLLTDPAGLTAATAAQRVLAETAVVARERPNDPRHLLLAPGRDWRPDVAVARAELAALAAAPWVTLSPVSTLIGTADPGVERAALPERATVDGEMAASQIGELRAARTELATFATLVPDPNALVKGTDAVVLAPLSVAWRADPPGRDVVVRNVVAELAARRTGVFVVPGSVLNLISQTGTFPVGLRNDLDQDVTVQVALVPENRLLVVAKSESVTVPAGSETQARIPFHAVGSGDVQVEVTLLAPDGTAVSGPIPFTVRVRADWENVGTAVVAGVLGLMFLFGIARTIRRGQTANRGASDAEIAEIAGPREDQP